uniref:RNA methyltransferase n=1 Tax=Timema californicum TaxID=61474 RepID=A0A7R9J4B1_TIMCA|nr:unnamed protein product [Timema californicum]
MSAQVEQQPVKVGSTDDKNLHQGKGPPKEFDKPRRKSAIGTTGPFPKKNKHETDGRNFKFGRKRAQSFTTGNGKFFPPYKRRKKEGHIIPPTKFLLGGNIYDPLNLNSLQDEEINRTMNAITPKSSPIPTPKHRKGVIEVIIPPNIKDPLNLTSCEDNAEYEQQLVSPVKKNKKPRHRKKKRNSSSGGSSKEDNVDMSTQNVSGVEKITPAEENTEASPVEGQEAAAKVVPEETPIKRIELELPLKEKKENKRRKSDLKDKIVSPVIPQPGAWKRPPQHGPNSDGRFRYRGTANKQKKGQNPPQMPKFKEKDAHYQYGNYLRYYGYRNQKCESDIRLKCFLEKRELFQDKDVLDIGCNIGHVTLSVARDFGAKTVVGLDIDGRLIGIARKNIRHYVNCSTTNSPAGPGRAVRDRFFPISMPIIYGPVDIPGQSPVAHRGFPHNVTFVQGNYILESDTLLQTEQPQFDVVLCLSITKWLHLNWGDGGLKQAFKRMFLQLRPGGRLILEAQAWESYKKKKNLTEKIFNNYHSIKLFPQKFTEYLLSSEVGFSKCEVIGTPFHPSKGFRRPIQLFTKGEISPSLSARSSMYTPCHTVVSGVGRLPVYTNMAVSVRENDEEEMDTEKSTPATPLAGSAIYEDVICPIETPQESVPEYLEVDVSAQDICASGHETVVSGDTEMVTLVSVSPNDTRHDFEVIDLESNASELGLDIDKGIPDTSIRSPAECTVVSPSLDQNIQSEPMISENTNGTGVELNTTSALANYATKAGSWDKELASRPDVCGFKPSRGLKEPWKNSLL